MPIYIGKGKNDRCLQHFSDKKKSEKVSKINELKNSGRLGIDILAYDLDEKTSFALESACIDLLNIDNLTNSVRGHGVNTKRLPIYELASKLSEEKVTIPHDHRGVAYLLEKTYKHDFGDLAILEHTRGIWRHKHSEDIKFAYATYRGIIKEVYKIFTWVPAGTQEYFTRVLNPEAVSKRWEFVGKKADDSIRELYVGKIINKPRSYSNPYVKVGFDNFSASES